MTKQVISSKDLKPEMVFNELTFKHFLPKKPYEQKRGLFLCSCGKEHESAISFVLRGTTKSCGCFHAKRIKEHNDKIKATAKNPSKCSLSEIEVGKRFGCLEVLEKTRNESNKLTAKWLVKCDCGKTKEVVSQRVAAAIGEKCICPIEKENKIDVSSLERGMKFSEFTLLNKTLPKKGRFAETWEMQCSCGKISSREVHNVIYERTKSCGCKKGRLISTAKTLNRNGVKRDDMPEYQTWINMRKRCDGSFPQNPKNMHYFLKGIKVCDRWENSFEDFYADMGEMPSKDHSIDRIDNNGDYCPENCRWATKKDQALNKSTSVLVEFNGVTKNISMWWKEMGIHNSMYYSYLKKIKDPKQTLIFLAEKKSIKLETLGK